MLVAAADRMQALPITDSMGDNNINRRITSSLNMPGRLRRVTSKWPSDYFLFPKLKEHLSGTRISSENDVETVAENWLNGQDVISAKLG
ncbi:hypothetical protein AVEN_244225-1 [Araneus ventricosus]|uniref:Uncharacterized protein n=1 Tax=Araneus ventricosus TaxID=182803 RepID=A0A4Y2R4P5_ARAVE|nr:hypothetical protein AVEN_244225-1 [Araneus ventricosus]